MSNLLWIIGYLVGYAVTWALAVRWCAHDWRAARLPIREGQVRFFVGWSLLPALAWPVILPGFTVYWIVSRGLYGIGCRLAGVREGSR